MADGYVLNWSGFCQAKIDGDAPSALLVDFEAPPMADVAASGAEVEAQRVSANEGGRLPGEFDVLLVPAICPQCSVASTSGAATRGGGLRGVAQSPADGATEAGSF